MALINDKVYVIGHRNPDTDSICSAISYAYFKNQLDHVTDHYIAKRAGDVNDETKYVLERFGFEAPDYVADISNRIGDIEIRRTKGVERTISLKEAWEIMGQEDVDTLPVTRNGRLEGIITMMDIAKSYMDADDNRMISTAHTKYRKITETIDGKMFCGNLEDYCTDGKMLIAAADEDYMSSQIEKGDLVVLGNREKLQLRAITEGAGTIVVCTGSKISQSVIDTANEYHCNVIGSKYDTFRVVRLIGQSMPVSYFMKRDNLVTFQMDDLTESMRQVMSQKRYKYFPVIDRKGHYVGMVSKRNLIDEGKRGVILVDHNEKTQAVDGIEAAEIVEIIDHHKIGNIQTILPVYFRNQPVGCTATIIFQRFLEEKIEIPQNIAGLLLSAILSDTLMFRSPTCTFIDEAAAKELAKIAQVEIEELATAMFTAGSNFDSKSCEEIFYMDFKKFNINGQTFGIGQVNVLTKEDERKVKERMIEYLEETHEKHGLDMVFFALTNIMEESSDMLYAGDRARACMQEAYDTEPGENSIYLPGVVSRKKQIIPALMSALQG